LLYFTLYCCFRRFSSMGLSPIKSLNSSKKNFTPSFERSFDENNGNKRTVLEANMRGRKQPPLSSSIFAENNLDFPSAAVNQPSSSSSSSHFPLKTPTPDLRDRSFLADFEKNRLSVQEISVGDILLPPATLSGSSNSGAVAPSSSLRSAHPYLSLAANISPAMDRLVRFLSFSFSFSLFVILILLFLFSFSSLSLLLFV
jgi:hypothetical protein